MLVNNSLALSQCLKHVVLSAVQTKQRSPILPFERKKGLNGSPMSQSLFGSFTAQWDTALVWQVVDNGAFWVYQLPNLMPVALRAQTISLKQGRSC